MHASGVFALAQAFELLRSGLFEAVSESPFVFWRSRNRKTKRERGWWFRWVVPLVLLPLVAPTGFAQQWERGSLEGGMVVSLGAGVERTVYLGTADGHVFASDDGASSWQLRGRIGGRRDAVVTGLAVDAENANLVFAAVWFREEAENGGIFRSDDGGRSWRPSGLEGQAVRALEAAPSNHTRLVAGTRTGVFGSRDGGTSWQRISPEDAAELRNVDSIAIDPRDPEVIYAGTYHLPWRTKDGGKSWEPVIAGIIDDSDIMSLRVDATNPDRVYMSACSGIYRSENQGAQWTKLQGIPYASRRTQTIVQDPANPRAFYAGTTEGAWVTRDSGETWTRTTPKDWVVNSVSVLTDRFPHSGRIVMGTESGVQISDDNGETFTASNRGFTHVIVKQLAGSFSGNDKILALVERNGWELLESADGAESWIPVRLTEAQSGKPVLNPDEVEQVLGSPWAWMLRMADGRYWIQQAQGSWQQWKPRMSAEAVGPKNSARKKTPNARISTDITPRAIAFSEDSATVIGREGAARCDKTGLCKPLEAFRGTGPASIWTSRSGAEIAVVQDAKFGLSTDGGKTASWRDLPVAGMKSLWIGSAEGQAFFLLGTSSGLFLSEDGGFRWRALGNGLPAGSIEVWLADGGFWLVSERSGGLYLSRNRGQNWTRIDREAERGRFAGLRKVGDGAVVVGSESEGILQLRVLKTRE